MHPGVSEAGACGAHIEAVPQAARIGTRGRQGTVDAPSGARVIPILEMSAVSRHICLSVAHVGTIRTEKTVQYLPAALGEANVTRAGCVPGKRECETVDALQEEGF